MCRRCCCCCFGAAAEPAAAGSSDRAAREQDGHCCDGPLLLSTSNLDVLKDRTQTAENIKDCILQETRATAAPTPLGHLSCICGHATCFEHETLIPKPLKVPGSRATGPKQVPWKRKSGEGVGLVDASSRTPQQAKKMAKRTRRHCCCPFSL